MAVEERESGRLVVARAQAPLLLLDIMSFHGAPRE